MRKIYKIGTNVLEQLIINAKDWLSPQRGASQKDSYTNTHNQDNSRDYLFRIVPIFTIFRICAIFHNVFSLLCKLLTKFYRR
jgi:hypothetical protein